mgnify:CR=1 FL=1
MTTPRQDPTFSPAVFIFGYSLPGLAQFGRQRRYSYQAIFGTRPFGGEIPGKNQENDMLSFIYGSPNPRATGPWAVTPFMTCRISNAWARRVIFYIWRGRQMVRRMTPYDASAKDNLVPWQIRLEEGAALWHTLTPSARARLHADAMRTRQAKQAYNYWSKLYIKDDPRWRNYV